MKSFHLVLAVVVVSSVATPAQSQSVEDAIRLLLTDANELAGSTSCRELQTGRALVVAARELAARRASLSARKAELNGLVEMWDKLTSKCSSLTGNGSGSSRGGGGGITIMQAPIVIGGGGRCTNCGRTPPDMLTYFLADDETRQLIMRQSNLEFTTTLRTWTAQNGEVIRELESLRELGVSSKTAKLLNEGRTFEFQPFTPMLDDREWLRNLKVCDEQSRAGCIRILPKSDDKEIKPRPRNN